MKKEITISAKTVEEAKALAAAELGVSESEIDFTVLAEAKKGFLGIGSADAQVLAVYSPRGEKNAVEFIKTIVEDMGIDADITPKSGENGALVIEVSGGDAGMLIGHHGDTLDALQYLAGLAANRRDRNEEGEKEEKGEYIKVTLDVEGYREKREVTLRTLARRQAEKVLKYKRSIMLEPMNPYERRIIHSEIQSIDGVSTNSIGSENNRKIVIFLDEKAEKNN